MGEEGNAIKLVMFRWHIYMKMNESLDNCGGSFLVFSWERPFYAIKLSFGSFDVENLRRKLSDFIKKTRYITSEIDLNEICPVVSGQQTFSCIHKICKRNINHCAYTIPFYTI